ncbi:hypothetical protein EON63_22890 [archaeon]|nr:MAG: hypothetical protein EON63_22890 [archaeon]
MADKISASAAKKKNKWVEEEEEEEVLPVSHLEFYHATLSPHHCHMPQSSDIHTPCTKCLALYTP